MYNLEFLKMVLSLYQRIKNFYIRYRIRTIIDYKSYFFFIFIYVSYQWFNLILSQPSGVMTHDIWLREVIAMSVFLISIALLLILARPYSIDELEEKLEEKYGSK